MMLIVDPVGRGDFDQNALITLIKIIVTQDEEWKDSFDDQDDNTQKFKKIPNHKLVQLEKSYIRRQNNNIMKQEENDFRQNMILMAKDKG